MIFGYNTNGFAHHPLEHALAILADLGYGAVAITLDYHALDPYEADLPRRVVSVAHQLARLGLRSVVETGARFLLDPLRKHQPTLLSPAVEAREQRLDFLRWAVRIAADLGSDAVSFWSGTPEDTVAPEVHFGRLVDGCRLLCDEAAQCGVRLAFEPEPGMLIDTMDRFAALWEAVQNPAFGLTLDIGHLHCQGEVPIADHLRRWREVLWNIHIEDMRRGVHDHLMFGEGEIDFGPILRTLQEINYVGGVYVELSRHSHDAVNTARQALAFLNKHLGAT
jgi:sugar phosphate isomerase/epimerase